MQNGIFKELYYVFTVSFFSPHRPIAASLLVEHPARDAFQNSNVVLQGLVSNTA